MLLAEQTLRAAQLALEADRELLAEGKGSTRDIIRSLEALSEAQVGRLAAEIDLQSSMMGLLKLEGTLLESVGLRVE